MRGVRFDEDHKTCSLCDRIKPVDEFYFRGGKARTLKDGTKSKARQSRCKSCVSVLAGRNPKLGAYQQKSKLKSRYGLGAFDEMLQTQNGVCAICGQTNSGGKRLAVDHDHRTNLIRGLLCTNCNLGLGNFKDCEELLQSAITYLQRSKDGKFHSGRRPRL